MTSLIKHHRGRVVDSPGDNVLAEFSSVVDAVQCAVAVQNEIQTRNAELAENRRMEFRIGINLGDVIDEEDRIYGDGVNVAARLEALADPGGICVSKTAFDQIETKLPLGYEYLGEQSVKNIPKPVGAYRVLMQPRVTVAEVQDKEKPAKVRRMPILVGVVAIIVLAVAVGVWYLIMRPTQPPMETASLERMAFPLPDKPSIAVLAFENMSGDPEQEYFSDGLSEEIITALSKTPKLFVIARNSSFTYKGKPVKVQQVGRELGVKYVLEGSVRKAGDRVRITAQLVDAKTENHLWADRYDRDLKDIFALQDEITMKILTALQVKLTEGAQANLFAKGTKNIEAYLKGLQALAIIQDFKIENHNLLKQLAAEAITLDPNYPTAYTMLAWSYLMEIFYGLTKTPAKSLERAFELAQKSSALDETLSFPHVTLGVIYMLKRQHDKAIAEGERAVELNPNSAQAQQNLARFLYNGSRPKESIPYFKKAKRLNPYVRSAYYIQFGCANWMIRDYKETIAVCKQGLKINPDEMWIHMILAATYIELGRTSEAGEAVAEALRIKPNLSLNWLAKVIPWENRDDLDRFISALREAELPEHPPQVESKKP
jgi:adenylate cyclase